MNAMSIINYFQANFLNSSSAAFALFERNPVKYGGLLTKMLEAKSEAVELKLVNRSTSEKQLSRLREKQDKYIKMNEVKDFIVKGTLMSDSGKYWATGLFLQTVNTISNAPKSVQHINALRLINNQSKRETQSPPKSWFNHLTMGDREHPLAFFSQPEKVTVAEPIKKVAFDVRENEIIPDLQGELNYAEEYEHDSGSFSSSVDYESVTSFSSEYDDYNEIHPAQKR